MKTNSFSFTTSRYLWAAGISTLVLIGLARGQTQTNRALSLLVTSSDSAMVKGARVYSIKFPGGTAGEFFEFLRTNGFGADNILFAGRAAAVHVPSFSVKRVRLTDIAKSLELVTEGKLTVDVVAQGEQSDENIWRVKTPEAASQVRTKTCPMPNFFRTPNAAERIPVIVQVVEEVVARQLANSGRAGESGRAHTLDTEKMVVVVGAEAYVEAVSSALEAAGVVAAADVPALRPKCRRSSRYQRQSPWGL